MPLRCAWLLLALASFSPAALQAAEPEGARAFIDKIYSSYPRRSPPKPDEFYALFAAELRSLLIRNDNYDPNEVGPLNGDPICDCQDDTGFSHRLIDVSESATGATARVANIFGPPAPPSEKLMTYRLVREAGAWRIADIESDDVPSFKAWLAAELSKPR